MKVTIKGFIYAEQHTEWDCEKRTFTASLKFDFSTYKKSTEYSPNAVLVRDHEIEVDIPDGLDIRAGLIDNLEAEKHAAMAAYQKRVTDLNAQIQSLLAIEA